MNQLEKLKDWIIKADKFTCKTISKEYYTHRSDAYHSVLSEIDRLRSEEEFCEWKKENNYGYFIDCIQKMIIEPAKINYCPYCGRKIKEV